MVDNHVSFTMFRRVLFIGGILLLLAYFVGIIIAWPSKNGPQIIIPDAASLIPTVGLILLVLSGLIAAAMRSGWRRVVPLLSLALVIPVVGLSLGLAQSILVRREIDRVILPSGPIVMMTLEPVFTDTIFALWWPDGWRWQAVFDAGHQITYSEDGSFTANPRLVLSQDGRHLMIHRGGIWTDCWSIPAEMTPSEPTPCLAGQNHSPGRRREWLDRSDRIAAAIGAEPTRP